ncbi:adhesion G-protein coupled receptor G2-like [Xenia sp. Carnegie-2017]|uniref:adhesion G-protein coupled receptor G2-like n=1 Tax=Xenia sp. Carnegie-2017 TaxID=2897299 RepID=UPI001F04893C|nr:adhesion G-protein coupled receptor G2-like [Xenia sp. Carnegie-2017]
MSVVSVTKQLKYITGINVTIFTVDDVILTTLLLERIVMQTQDLNKTGVNIVNIVDNLLNAGYDILTQGQMKSNTSARIVRVLDTFLGNVFLRNGTAFRQNETNLAVFTKDYSPREFQGAGAASINKIVKQNFEVYDNDMEVKQNTSQVSITLPQSLFENLDIDSNSRKHRISFAIYRSTLIFESSRKALESMSMKTVHVMKSYVISGSVKGQELYNVTEPVVTTYKPLKAAVDDSTACVFFSFSANNGKGDWKFDGCSFQGLENGVVKCYCTHLTNFAILMVMHLFY